MRLELVVELHQRDRGAARKFGLLVEELVHALNDGINDTRDGTGTVEDEGDVRGGDALMAHDAWSFYASGRSERRLQRQLSPWRVLFGRTAFHTSVV